MLGKDKTVNKGTGDRMKGEAKDIAGKTQEKFGEATGDANQQARGEEKQMEGKVDKTKGNVKNAVNDITR